MQYKFEPDDSKHTDNDLVDSPTRNKTRHGADLLGFPNKRTCPLSPTSAYPQPATAAPSVQIGTPKATASIKRVKPVFSPRTKTSINDLLDSTYQAHPIKTKMDKKKIAKEITHTIYPLSGILELIETRKQNKSWNAEEPDLRFVLDSHLVAWFAGESKSYLTAPPHFGLVAQEFKSAICLTAGNLYFSADYKTLIKISNKSGDFEPAFHSLKWLLALLILNKEQLPFELPDILEVMHLSAGTSIVATYQWSMAQIQQWIDSCIDAKHISEQQMTMLTSQTLDKKNITLVATHRPADAFSVVPVPHSAGEQNYAAPSSEISPMPDTMNPHIPNSFGSINMCLTPRLNRAQNRFTGAITPLTFREANDRLDARHNVSSPQLFARSSHNWTARSFLHSSSRPSFANDYSDEENTDSFEGKSFKY